MANAKKPVRVTMTLPDGTRKYYSGRTKKEAESKRDKARLMYAMGYDAASNLTFAELAGLTTTAPGISTRAQSKLPRGLSIGILFRNLAVCV